MTYAKVREVLDKYYSILGAHIPERGAHCRLCHCKGMIDEISTWDADRMDKAFRWLGFIQGVFWCEKVYTLDEMKGHNKP